MNTNPLQTQLEHYVDLFKSTTSSINGMRELPAFQRQLRAIEHLKKVEFPNRKNEDWKYTSALPILQRGKKIPTISDVLPSKSSDVLADLDAVRIYVVNGVIDTKRSDDLNAVPGLKVYPISENNNQELFDQMASGERDAFGLLNQAFSTNAMVFEVDENAAVDKKLLFIHSNTPGTEYFLNSNRIVLVNKSGNLEMIDLYPVSDADNSFINSGVAIYLGENAQLSHYRYQYDTASNYYVNNTRIFQDANSTYSSYVLDTGGKSVRNNLYTYLKGSNTNTNYYGGYLVSGKQHIDNQTFIDHAMPHCESNELYKGILDDRSSGVFNGKVMVRPDAQKTNAFQQNSNLVLSPDAKMNTKPQLEIYADDVKCSHGATVGQLDEQSMYYLRSRGLNKGEAKRLLQFAFIAEVVESFENDQMRDFAEQIVREKM